MKLLKIEDRKGYFYDISKKTYNTIDNISREPLLALVRYVLSNDDYSFDEYEDNIIDNKAQAIVYKDIHTKLNEINNNKQSIINSVKSDFKAAKEKYIQ